MTRSVSTNDGEVVRPVGCVYVVGMHRSGTSAAAELLARLGLGTPLPEDLIPATRSNLHGHWESKQLVAFNHRLLVRLGGTWTAPPRLEKGWEAAHGLDDLRMEATGLFRRVFTSRPMAWKDPRLCVVLPFWQTVVEQPSAALFVFRRPTEVALSLERRDGIAATHGFALWERYVRSACACLEGVPTLAADYASILDRPAAYCDELVGFLSDMGIGVPEDARKEAYGSVDSEMRHQTSKCVRKDPMSQDAESLYSELCDLEGRHLPWRAPALEPEPGWVGDVLAMRLETDTLRREQRAYEDSRAHRLVSQVQHALRRNRSRR